MNQEIVIMFVSPLGHRVEHVDKIRVWCHQCEGQALVSTPTILCNLKFRVITHPMFVCLREMNRLRILRYNFQFSLYLSSYCESICLDLCNHKKDNCCFDVLSVDTIEDTRLLELSGTQLPYHMAVFIITYNAYIVQF